MCQELSTTYYQILDDQLRIKSGFLMDRRIPIRSITKIVKTCNVLPLPDRKEISASVVSSPEPGKNILWQYTTFAALIQKTFRHDRHETVRRSAYQDAFFSKLWSCYHQFAVFYHSPGH
ncbi:PH domain-containing protein [Dyadobacter chenhuakuii]|uniref:PH domain-containing protein n=1 Tax=Dyadobacter chenhuakuii TaxID=2909339 RepID=UPI0035B6A510